MVAKKTVEIALKDISRFSWTPVVDFQSVFHVVPIRTDRDEWIFEGFQLSQFNALQSYADQVSKPLSEVKIDVSGRNWGDVDVDERGFVVATTKYDDGSTKLLWKLDSRDCQQVVQQSNTTVALEFNINEDAMADGSHELCELRVYVPPSESDDKNENSNIATLKQKIEDAGGLGDNVDEPVTIMSDIKLVVPRGKHEFAIHKDFFRFSSIRFSYKQKYSNVKKLIQLPLPDRGLIMFIIGLSKPMRYGSSNKTHEWLVLEFPALQESLVDLNLDPEELAEHKALLMATMRGPSHVVFSRLLKAFTGRPVIVPGKSYTASDGVNKCVSCSYGVNPGYLFLLEKSFFFINKPAMLCSHKDIESVGFSRMDGGMSGRIFDLEIKISGQKNFTSFTNIDRKEYNAIFDFLVKKEIHIENIKVRKQQRNKIGGRNANRASYVEAAEFFDEEDDEDEDEDFEVGSEDESSSESDSELGSEASMSEGEGGEVKPKKKKSSSSSSSSSSSKSEKKPSSSSSAKKQDRAAKKKKLDKQLKKAGIKRPPTSYAIFMKEIRPEIVADQPSMPFKEVSEAVALKWRGLSDEQKEVYKQKQEEAKKEFEEKVAALPEAVTDDDESTKEDKKDKKKKKKKDPNAPKRNISAYQFFMKGERTAIKEKNPELSNKELLSAVGAAWKAASNEERAKYEEEAVADKERYRVEQEAYEVKRKEKKAEKKKRKLEEAGLGNDDEEGPKKKKKKKNKKKSKKKDKKQKKESGEEEEEEEIESGEEEEQEQEEAEADGEAEAMDVTSD